jgi:hypothetical protein
LDEEGIAIPDAPKGPNAIAADHMLAKSPRHFVPIRLHHSYEAKYHDAAFTPS